MDCSFFVSSAYERPAATIAPVDPPNNKPSFLAKVRQTEKAKLSFTL